MEGFSTTYSAYDQRRFLELLDAGDLEKAVEKLEEMPRGVNLAENTQRLRVKLEGYRRIISRLLPVLPGLDKETLEGYVRLSAEYQKHFSDKNVEDLTEDILELTNYRALGELMVLGEKLKMLDAYEEIGTVEEFREMRDVSRRLQEI